MNKLVQNAGWIIISKVAQSLLSLLIGMMTARYLGPSNYGLITYAASLVAFVSPVATLGYSHILVHEIIDHPEKEGQTIGTVIIFNLFSSIGCILCIFIYTIIIFLNEPLTIIVCLLYSTVLLFKGVEQIKYYFQAKLLSKYSSLIGLFAYFMVSIYKIFLLIKSKNIYWFVLSNLLEIVIVSLLNLIIYNKLSVCKLSLSLKAGCKMFLKSRHYILSSMMVTVFVQTDKIMLKSMIDNAAIGYYGAAITCAGIFTFVFTAIIDTFRPYIFEGNKISTKIFENRLITLYSIIIYLSLCQSIIMSIFSKIIINLLYGDKYLISANVLKILVWYSTFSYLGSVRNIWILANNKQRYLWIINISGATSNIILNFLLIPKIGINGAAIASLITQFFTNVIVGYCIKPILRNNELIIKSLNPKILFDLCLKLCSQQKINFA